MMLKAGDCIVIDGKGWERAQGRVVGPGASAGYIHLQLETATAYQADGDRPRQPFRSGTTVEVSVEAVVGHVDDTPPAPPSPPPAVSRMAHYLDPDYGVSHLAAIITEVIPADDSSEVTLVALTVFPPDAAPYPVVNVEQGDGARQWHWPERVGR